MELHSVLKAVVAYVEVRSGNDNRSAAIAQELRYLGARVEASFTDAVTHVVFKEGLKRTWNKAMRRKVHLVSVSWIDSCKQNQIQMPEKDFAAVLPEEISSPLPRILQPVRWKKMKSMQPCDFDEELARSAERGEKKRRRLMAGKLTLDEVVTPTSSSPIPVLAYETQARRSPISATVTRVNSPIPDTPPSMQERLERMRREQKQVLNMDPDISPPTTPKAQSDKVLQRRLYDLFTMDTVSTGSSNEDDDAAIKTVSDIIRGLDSESESGSQRTAEGKVSVALVTESLEKNPGGPSESQAAAPVSALSPGESAVGVSSNKGSTADREFTFSNSQSPPDSEVNIHSNRRSILGRSAGIFSAKRSTSDIEARISTNKISTSNIEASISSNKRSTSDLEASIYSNKRSIRASRMSCGDRTSAAGASLDHSLPSSRVGSRSVQVSENNSRQSTPRCNPKRRRTSSMLNALSPKDLNIDTPPLDAKLAAFQESSDVISLQGKSDAVEISQNTHGPSKSRRSLILALSGENAGRLETAENIVSMVGVSNAVSAQFSQSKTRRSSRRQSLVPKAKVDVDVLSSLESEEMRRPVRTCPDENNTNVKPQVIKSTCEAQKCSTATNGTVASEIPTRISRKKRNLFTDASSTAFSLCSNETFPRQRSSPEVPSPPNPKVQSVGSNIKSDISFMFGFTKSGKSKSVTNKTNRRSQNLRSSQTSEVDCSELGQNDVSCWSKNMPTKHNGQYKTAAVVGTSLSSCEQQNHSSFGDSLVSGEMSMSLAYGHESSNTTRAGTSRRSLDDFRTNTRTTDKVRKLRRASVLNPKSVKSNNDTEKVDKVKNKNARPNRNAKQNKMKMKCDLSPGNNSEGKKSVQDKGSDLSLSTDVPTTVSESSEEEVVPARLRHANSLLMEEKRQPPSKRIPYSLVVTSLHRDEQETVYAVVKKLGVFHMTSNVKATSTHVVCGEARRTLNLLKAIASGCWLLRKEWVLESLEADTWLQEEHYEMTDFPAAVKSRCERQKVGVNYKVDLFSKSGPIFVSATCTPPRKEIVHLINLCCGQVTGSETRAAIHLGDEHSPKKLVIKPVWVLDCIMKLETLPVDNYIVFAKTDAQREDSPEF